MTDAITRLRKLLSESPDHCLIHRNDLTALLDIAEAAEKCLPHVDPKALDFTMVHNQKLNDCYLNTMLRKSLAALSNHQPTQQQVEGK